MRPRPMIITKVTFQNSPEMLLVDYDHVVQAFSANTSDNPFRITVLPRAPGRYRNLADTQSIHSCCEIMTIDPITISYQVARDLLPAAPVCAENLSSEGGRDEP